MSVQTWQRLTEAKNVLRWGIFPGKYFYIADFFEAAYEVFPQQSSFHWPQSLGLFVDNEMLILVELDKLQLVGKKAFEYYFFNQARKENLLKTCDQQYQYLKSFFSKFPDLTTFSQEDLNQFGLVLHKQLLDFWLVTLPIELANYGGWAWLEFEAREAKWGCSMIDLVALELPTFYQQEELELAMCATIHTHQQKYFWLRNSYHHTEILMPEFFVQRKKLLKQTLLQKQSEHFAKVKMRKLAIIQTNDFTLEQIAIMENLTLGLWLQEERKQYILQLQHYKELFLQAVHRLVPEVQANVYSYSLKELIILLEGKCISSRPQTFGVVCKTHNIQLLSMSETKAYWHMQADEKTADHLKFEGKVLIASKRKSIRAPVTFFDSKATLDTCKNTIVCIKSISSEHVYILRDVKALILESCEMITHTLLAALAHMYVGKLPTIVVIPNVSKFIAPLTEVNLTVRYNKVLLRQTFSFQGKVAAAPTNMSSLQGKIVLDPSPYSAHLENKIVILPYLSVDMIFFYRHVRCIITDTGGITCHGAIICRELGIPCLVGVVNATKVLVTGDVIEVNFKTGEVKIVG